MATAIGLTAVLSGAWSAMDKQPLLLTDTLFAASAYVALLLMLRSWLVRRVIRPLENLADNANADLHAQRDSLATVSHEIRTPLNAIIGTTELALDTVADSVQREHLETIHSSSTALLQLANDLLDLSRMVAGKLELEAKEFDVVTVVENACDLMAHAAGAESLEIVCDIPPDLPRVFRGDAGRLRQVLLNLLGNAIKFTDAGYVATMVRAESVSPSNATLVFEIADTGIGIPADRVGAVFDAFEQVEAMTAKRYGGAGLGLAICQNIVQMMNGHISVESTEGRGSTFRFDVRLLRSPVTDSHIERPFDDAIRPCEDLRDRRILIVDDHDRTRQVLERTLRHWGCMPDHASSGELSLEKVRRAQQDGTPYNLVLLDVHIPGMDSREVYHRLTTDDEFGHPRIVWLGAPRDRNLIAQHCSASQPQFLSKPIRWSALIETLRSMPNLTPAKETSLQLNPAPFAPESGSVGLHILLVEDDRTNQHLMRRLLEKLNHTVTTVDTGRHALEQLESTSFDLVFMDVRLPDMSGTETVRRMRTEQRWARIPVVALTANALSDSKEECLVAGMNDYITKPASIGALRTICDKWSDTLQAAPVCNQ